MIWRRLRPGELNHEAIWLVVSVATLFGVWLWLHLAYPVPQCVFHRITGLPCPTCGVTRCLRHAFHGEWKVAAAFNPLALMGLAFGAGYNLYAAAVLVFRMPRLRFDHLSPLTRTGIRFAAIAVILGNWAWLLWMQV